MKILQFKRTVLMVGGLAVLGYGISLLFGLTEFDIGKWSAAERDTSTAIITCLLGLVLFLYGWFDPAAIRGQSGDHPADKA